VESGSNDPMAVFLTVVLCSWIALGELSGGGGALAARLTQQIGVGALGGMAGGWLIARGLNRLALPEGLHPILALAGAVATFAATNQLGGSGFLAVYVAGLWVGNRPVRAIANVTAVQDAATWLAQAVMFILLGLLVHPSALGTVLWPALLLAGVLMLIARPAAVWLCLAPFGFRKREVAFVGWVGLRGAVGIFLASLPLLLELPNAALYFNVAFVVVAASLLVQGWTLKPAAHWLQVALPRREVSTRRIELDLPGQLEMEIVGYSVGSGSAILGAQAALPGWARPAMVVREGRILLPNEAGPAQAGDTAYFLAPPGEVYRLDWLFAEGDAAAEHAREMFGAFALPGDVPLGDLADFYGLPVPERYRGVTAAALFANRYDNAAQIGDRLPLGGATLVVRRVQDERPVEVGLLFEPSPTGWLAARLAPVRQAWQRLFP
jgi:cell volume regulation protein A